MTQGLDNIMTSCKGYEPLTHGLEVNLVFKKLLTIIDTHKIQTANKHGKNNSFRLFVLTN